MCTIRANAQDTYGHELLPRNDVGVLPSGQNDTFGSVCVRTEHDGAGGREANIDECRTTYSHRGGLYLLARRG